jgi:hypothetical protein
MNRLGENRPKFCQLSHIIPTCQETGRVPADRFMLAACLSGDVHKLLEIAFAALGDCRSPTIKYKITKLTAPARKRAAERRNHRDFHH